MSFCASQIFHAKVARRANESETTSPIADGRPAKWNIRNGAGIYLNASAAKQPALKLPFLAPVQRSWCA